MSESNPNPGSSSSPTIDSDAPPSYRAATTSSPPSTPGPAPVFEPAVEPQTTLNFTVKNVEDTVLGITKAEFYVGNPGLKDLVKWQAQATNYILVRKDNEEEAEIEWFGEIDARLACFYLYADGGWKLEFNATSPLPSMKARALVIKPSRNNWLSAAAHWDDIINGFKTIQSLKTTRGATPLNMIIEKNNQGCKVRHIIFEPINDNNDNKTGNNAEDVGTEVPVDDSPSSVDSISRTAESPEPGSAGDTQDTKGKGKGKLTDQPKDPFLMENWVCSTPAAKAELKKLVAGREFIGNILPAYTSHMGHDSLIPPAEYEPRLRGALVSFKTAITYQYMGGKLNSDNYYAEIREIKVISPPPAAPASPSKKRLRQAQDDLNRKRKAVN